MNTGPVDCCNDLDILTDSDSAYRTDTHKPLQGVNMMTHEEMKGLAEKIEGRISDIAGKLRYLRAERIVEGLQVAPVSNNQDQGGWPEDFGDLPTGEGVVTPDFLNLVNDKDNEEEPIFIELGLQSTEKSGVNFGSIGVERDGNVFREGIFFTCETFDEALDLIEKIILSPENVEGRISEYRHR